MDFSDKTRLSSGQEITPEAHPVKEEKQDIIHNVSTMEPFALLSEKLSKEDQIKLIASKCNVVYEQVENAYPCTPMQESLVGVLDGSNNLSIRQLVFELSDVLVLDDFHQTWRNTIRAHPVLRTRVCHVEKGVGFLQVVTDEDLVWNTVEMDLEQFLQQDMATPMHEGDPCFRYTIVSDNNDEGRTRRHFIWTVHHAFCDGASLLGIFDELARRFHNKATLPREPFELFIKFLQIMGGSSADEQFWKRSLSGINPTPYPPIPQDPSFRPNPSSMIKQTIVFDRRPPLGLSRALFIRAAWAILLSHHTGTDDVVFGAINNGRKLPVPGVLQMTGPTINLVPVALHVDPKESIESFLLRVQAQATEMREFEHSGVSNIRKFLSGSGSMAADFQTLFVVHPMDFGDAAGPAAKKLSLKYMPNLGQKEQHSYPLVVSFTLSLISTDIILQIQYDEHIVSAQHVQNLIHQFQVVLTNMSNSPKDALLETISSLSDQDVAQIREWNKSTPPAEQICIHDMFRKQVLEQPTAQAVCSSEKSLTYAEVDTLSNSLALYLVELGVHAETFVAVCFEKSIWTVIAILAVFKAGGVYVPIDSTHPRARIAELTTMAQIKIAIASPSGSQILEGLCVQCVDVQNYPRSAISSLPKCSPSSTAYLLFTSGSTSKPKGILMSHSAMSTSILHHGTKFGAGPNWRTLQFASHTFDISLAEFLTTLAFGGCICIPSEHDRLNNLAEVITSLKVNTALVVPTVANLITPREVPTLRTIILGGEPVPKETILRWADHVNLTNGYGPSETAVYCGGNINIPSDAHPENIGHSIGGTMWIVNPENYHQLSAIGCVGEIVISGPILGKGYFSDKATTEAAFVPSPDWLRTMQPESPYRILYRTGDLARYNPDGTFHIVGRSDTQVKLRGFRIELGEIESQIMQSGTATAAFVVLASKGPCAHQIVATISFNRLELKSQSGSNIVHLKEKSTSGLLNQLKSHLSLTLPEYMIPSIWIVLEEMPRLSSGKIDRSTIRSWLHDMNLETYKELVEEPNDDKVAEFVPGTTANTLRQIWSEVLDTPIEQIQMNTSFFSLGGDSIFAIQVTSKAKALGLPVTVRGIITSRTLGNLAGIVDKSRATAPKLPQQPDNSRSTSDILLGYEKSLKLRLGNRPGNIEDAYLLSPFQREIMKQRNINPAIFLFSWQMEIFSQTSEAISLERVVRAWKSVIQKHPIFRSIFLQDSAKENPPVQVVLANADLEIATTSDETLPPVDECFLPHRARFYQDGQKIIGRIDLDHLVLDGWSLRLVKKALLAAYEETAESREAPALYKSFITALQPDRIDADNKYWAAAFGDQKPSLLSFPPHNAEPPPSPARTIIQLPALKAIELSSFTSKNGITTASIFEAAWAQTLSIFTKSPDVSFEYVVSGRDQELPHILDILGPIFNVLAYHLREVSTENNPMELANLAHKIQEQRIQDGQYISCNIREVLKDDLKMTNPFNTGLNFQRRPKAVWTESIRIDEDLRQSVDPWHFDVLVRVLHIVDDDSILPFLEFDARVFDQDIMNKVAEIFWERVQNALS